MGADAEVYLFDDRAYRALVAPLFRRLVRYGIGHPALNALIDPLRPHAGRILRFIWNDLRRLEPTDLDAHCTYLADDLRLLAPPAGLAQLLAAHTDEWHDRACHRKDCPASGGCPYFIEAVGHAASGLAYLFQIVVAQACLGESQFVGRSFTVFDYQPVLQKNQIPWDGELGQLLSALGTRGAVVGYGFGGTEGIHGWLSHEETAQLVRLLAQIPLPSFEASFEAMRRTLIPGEGYQLEGWEWDEVSLAFVRTTATIAAESGKGILWGNDVLGVVDARSEGGLPPYDSH